MCTSEPSDVGPVTRTAGRDSSYLALARELLFHRAMSRARPVFKQARLMVTRRVHGREFRLRPSKKTNAIIRYVIAVVAERTGIILHAVCVMSNHTHICLTDPEGRICEFTRDCHAFIARAVNAAHGDFESMWSSEQTSHVTCVEPDDLIAKIAYAMANPVAATLVKYGKNWPGVRAAWPAKARVVHRPKKFFRDEKDGGSWPDTAVLEFSRPPGYDGMSDEELAALIENEIDEREEHHRQEARRDGKSFMGRREVLEQSRYARPKKPEKRFELSPRVACRNKWLRIERLGHDRAWRGSYERALLDWRSGDRDVIFPYGTYKMRVVHNVFCAPPPV